MDRLNINRRTETDRDRQDGWGNIKLKIRTEAEMLMGQKTKTNQNCRGPNNTTHGLQPIISYIIGDTTILLTCWRFSLVCACMRVCVLHCFGMIITKTHIT